MKQKTRIIIYIAISVTALVLGIIAVLSIPDKSQAKTADEFIKTGNKYLIELSYDKAVIEFNKAIEIEPRNADAYIGLVEAYMGLGEDEKAIETLELGYENTRDERIKKMLDELLGITEKTEITTAEVTTETTTTVSETGNFIDEMVEIYIPMAFFEGPYDEYGYGSFMEHIYTGKGYEINVQSSQAEYCHVIYVISDELPFEADSRIDGPISIAISKYNDSYHYSFNHNKKTRYSVYENPEITKYNENGNIIERAENEYDLENRLVKSTVYNSDNEVIRVKELIYDENGLLNCVMENDKLRCECFYDNNGNKVKEIVYTYDGEENYIEEWEYDSNNNCVSYMHIGCTYSSKSRYNWEYDSSGNRIKETYMDINSSYSWEDTYDNNGNLIESGSDNYYDKYEYDSAGRMIKKYSDYNNDGEWDSIYTYRYDSDGVFYEYDWEYYSEYHSSKETTSYDPNTHHTVSENIKYMKIALPSIFIEQIKNEYGIDLAA
ncbi:MAG: tetratricopeptide repeat protein [Oscillospiraceae bacterium]|nr:tetratricopeptide repeat protein [Oscillospiraceae bacterium]